MRRVSDIALALLVPLLFTLAGCGASGYDSVQSPTSTAGYREFLFRQPNHPRAAQVRALLDEADFRKAGEDHTANAYQIYLAQHPSGKFVREARYWAERLTYYDAISSKNSEAVKNFLSKYPQSRFASQAEVRLQRTEFEEAQAKNSIPAYRQFLKRHLRVKSQYTAAARQRLERLLLDTAKAEQNPEALLLYIQQHPQSPYLQEARTAHRRLEFERVLQVRDEQRWRDFLWRYRGTHEAKLVAQHMEREMLRMAERSGRISALYQFLERYPNSPHKARIRTSIALARRERGQEAHRWVRILNPEIEVYRPRKCDKCVPVYRFQGVLESTDSDFLFNLTLEASLIRAGETCCQAQHRVEGLRPGERRPFSFEMTNPRPSGPLPQFKLRIVRGRALVDGQADIPGFSGESIPQDRFIPRAVSPLRRR
ncbi:MAG: hypothetical protein O2807_05670 [bacterium]|nr:hypothetical protein [bacterium]